MGQLSDAPVHETPVMCWTYTGKGPDASLKVGDHVQVRDSANERWGSKTVSYASRSLKEAGGRAWEYWRMAAGSVVIPAGQVRWLLWCCVLCLSIPLSCDTCEWGVKPDQTRTN